MKVIDLLNKIANGEESDIITEFEFDKKIWNFFKLQDSEYCIDGWLLNQEIVITKHKEIIEEDEKIRKLDFVEENTFSKRQNGMTSEDRRLLDSNFRELGNKINEIIDKLNESDKE